MELDMLVHLTAEYSKWTHIAHQVMLTTKACTNAVKSCHQIVSEYSDSIKRLFDYQGVNECW